MIFPDGQHGFNKVFAVSSEHPGDPYNKVLLKSSGHSLLSFKFRLSVYVERLISLKVRIPRRLTLSVKHIVR